MGISDLFDGDEMWNPLDHPSDLGSVGQLDGLVQATQAERAERPALLGLGADR
jgi:hypothetical protein